MTASRAPRFVLRVPLKYRARAGEEWFDGDIRNVSRSGILFRASRALAVDAAVEMRFALNVELGHTTGGTVICRGAVVRAEPPAAGDSRPTLAAAIRGYALVHADADGIRMDR